MGCCERHGALRERAETGTMVARWGCSDALLVDGSKTMARLACGVWYERYVTQRGGAKTTGVAVVSAMRSDGGSASSSKLRALVCDASSSCGPTSTSTSAWAAKLASLVLRGDSLALAVVDQSGDSRLFTQLPCSSRILSNLSLMNLHTRQEAGHSPSGIWPRSRWSRSAVQTALAIISPRSTPYSSTMARVAWKISSSMLSLLRRLFCGC
ncbi:hypothetical protein IWX91DRAFT_335206 [Phyllosticta citricarpa]